MRFDHAGDGANLDKAIQLVREVLNLCPPGYPTREKILNNLASDLNTRCGARYHGRPDPSDLSEAIQLAQESLDLCPPGHPSRRNVLDTLAACLRQRYEQSGDPNDLLQATQLIHTRRRERRVPA